MFAVRRVPTAASHHGIWGLCGRGRRGSGEGGESSGVWTSCCVAEQRPLTSAGCCCVMRRMCLRVGLLSHIAPTQGRKAERNALTGRGGQARASACISASVCVCVSACSRSTTRDVHVDKSCCYAALFWPLPGIQPVHIRIQVFLRLLSLSLSSRAPVPCLPGQLSPLFLSWACAQCGSFPDTHPYTHIHTYTHIYTHVRTRTTCPVAGVDRRTCTVTGETRIACCVSSASLCCSPSPLIRSSA